MNKSAGMIAAIAAYVLWGLLPVYWKLLEAVPAPEILCHRMVWSLVFTFFLVISLGKWRGFLARFKDRKTVLRVTLSGTLLAVNWLIYIWAVNNGHIIETSLGYYINPLVAVVLAVVVLGEKLRLGQCVALLSAVAGVIYLTVSYGQFPWIALSLAFSFAIYGLLHKTTSIPALEGLGMETVPLFLVAFGYLIYLDQNVGSSFIHDGLSVSLLLVLTGAATSIPLLLFGFAAKNIPFSTLGLLQYIAPTIGVLLGVFVYGEDFSQERMFGFSLVWFGLAIYLCEGWFKRYQLKRQKLAS